MPASPLVALERIKNRYAPGSGAAKRALLGQLARRRLRTAHQLLRLHEALCFLRAYPDDLRLRAQVTRMLSGFAQRADLRRHREALENSGVAGTVIRQALFWPMLRWLVERWPRRVLLDRMDRIAAQRISAALPVLLTVAEGEWLRARRTPGFAALDQLRPKRATDAAFFTRLVDALPGDGRTREAFHDAIEPLYVLVPGAGTPSRTLAYHATGPIVHQRTPLRRTRPDLRAEIRRAPLRVRRIGTREAETLLDLARAAMLTRERDLDAFAYGDPRAMRVVHEPGGLAFALNGVIPERRAPIAALFGALTLQNGVPIGYVQLDVAGRSAALSFNTFPTFRGAEAAYVFARMLAMAHHLLGVESFTVEPYQLGEGNDEAIESGAWWFYRKLGFAPRAAAARRLARRESARAAARAGYRSSAATLRALARAHLFFELDPSRPRPLPPLVALGERVSCALAPRAADRTAALDACVAEALARTGTRTLSRFTAAQRQAWRQWAPLIVALPGLGRWSRADKRALVEVVRAKAGASEFDYLRGFNAHPRLARALLGQRAP